MQLSSTSKHLQPLRKKRPDFGSRSFWLPRWQWRWFGEVVAETARYTRAEFAYTGRFSIGLSEDDIICWHPLIANALCGEAQLEAMRVTEFRPIYPLGADPADSSLITDAYRGVM